MKHFKIFLFLGTLLLSLISFAQTYPPFPSGSAPVYYGIYPVQIEVPYGKKAASPQTYQLQYYLVNTTSNTYTLSDYALVPVSPPGPNPVTITSYTNDCGGVLKPSGNNGVCNIFVNISAVNNNNAPITYNFSFKYSAGRPAVTQAAPPFTISFATGNLIPSASRTFTFVNNCPTTDLWFGIDSGAAPAITPNPAIQPADPQSCLTTTDCYPGSSCVQVQTNPTVLKHCFWANPAPTGYAPGNGSFKITGTSNPGSHTQTVSFPIYDNGIEIAWNGGIGGRVGCSDSTNTACKIADCGAGAASGNSGDACPVPGGFATPSTLAEFSLLTQNPVITSTSGTPAGDTYDITIINGVTVPMSMEPTNVGWSASTPYICGNPGARTTSAPLGACAWFTILPPNSGPAQQADFVWVDTNNPGSGCPCAGPDVCGHSITGATVSSLTCGTQLGYLTADAVCAIDKTFGAPFNCATTINENNVNYSMTDIYGCSVGDFKNSCYTTGATSACCGCQNWDSFATIPPGTQSCGAISNSNWQAALITTNFLPWLKEVCPTAYIYPFDDASSTFTCQDTDTNNNNVVDYTVTFCPS
jgi:hypothetical protein